MIGKRNSFAIATGPTLGELEAALTQIHNEGAPADAIVTFFPNGDAGPQIKAEWHIEEPDPAAPPADERPQPTTVTPEVQPDGLVNETPAQ